MSKRALVTGITGQDGSYLAELLLDKGYEVFGLTRRLSADNYWRIAHIRDRVTLLPGDLLDQLSLIRVLERVRPHELYNLAAMSFVPASWDQPMLTGEFNSQGVTRVLEAMRAGRSGDPVLPGVLVARCSARSARCRRANRRRSTRAAPTASPRSSPTTSRSTIARATTSSPRSGILFNHESPRRGLEFVTRKVTARRGADQARARRTRCALGNLDAQPRLGIRRRLRPRDVADAPAGRARRLRRRDRRGASVREFVEIAFGHAGLDWRRARPPGSGAAAPGRGRSPDRRCVARARITLGWSPSVDFRGLVTMMVDADLARIEKAT